MSEDSDARKIDLGDDFGDVVVKANGIRIDLHADGTVDAYTQGAVKAHSVANDTGNSKAALQVGNIEHDGAHKGEIHGGIAMQAAANDAGKAKATPKIPLCQGGFGGRVGDEMADGTILAGYYKGRALYTTPRDEPLIVTFKEAATQAGALNMINAFGHHDWRMPSKDALNALWENRNKGKLKGTFNNTGSIPAGWYRSSTLWNDDDGYNLGSWAQRFRDGYQNAFNCSYDVSSVRLVR